MRDPTTAILCQLGLHHLWLPRLLLARRAPPVGVGQRCAPVENVEWHPPSALDPLGVVSIESLKKIEGDVRILGSIGNLRLAELLRLPIAAPAWVSWGQLGSAGVRWGWGGHCDAGMTHRVMKGGIGMKG